MVIRSLKKPKIAELGNDPIKVSHDYASDLITAFAMFPGCDLVVTTGEEIWDPTLVVDQGWVKVRPSYIRAIILVQ